MPPTGSPTGPPGPSLLSALEQITGGEIGLLERSGKLRWFGRPTAGPDGRDPLRAVLRVHHPGVYEEVLLRGSVGLGTSYADGWWDTDDLPALLRLLERNVRRADPTRRSVRRLTGPVTDRVRRLRRADPARDRDDIRAHYDLGNDFFERWLDETMMYSSAIFPTEQATLAEASAHKLDRLCRRLALGPDDHVLEIGTGWGGFAVHAAERYGCRVTTTTISDRQFAYATDRVRAAGLDDRVTVLDRDYRELRGQFDAIVSIEMIEAVDWREYDTFFARLRSPAAPRWAPGHAGHRHPPPALRPGQGPPGLHQGGHLPRRAACPRSRPCWRSSSRASDLSLVDLEDIGLHYAETLRRWRANLDRVRGTTCPPSASTDRFGRLWEFYLAYCEAGFDERGHQRGAVRPGPTRVARPGISRG